MDLFYQLNTPKVACEIFDEEVILVHFESGFYYHVQGTGATICAMISAGYALSSVVRLLANHFRLPEAVVAADTEVFVAQMVDAQLLVRQPEPHKGSPTGTHRVPACVYAPPCLEKFDDLADQLLLDKLDEQPSA